MTAENHEDVFVFADQFLPHLFSGVSLDFISQFIDPFSIRSHVGMREYDDSMVGVPDDYLVCPLQNFVPRFALERDDEEIHPGGIEVIPGIVMAFGIKSSAKLLSFGKFITRKIFVEVGGPVDGDIAAVLVVRLLETHVVVSQAQAIGHFPVQYGHGFLCDCPFLVGVRLHDISLVDEKSDVEPLLVVTHPAGLIEKVASQISVAPLFGQLESSVAVKLSVRQNRDGESFRCLG